MHEIGILWHIVTYIVGERCLFVFFFSLMLHWLLNVSEPDRARKGGRKK